MSTPHVLFTTLGCAKNEVDTRDMQLRAVQAGYALCDDPAIADAVVINTCAFIQSATEESIAEVLEMADLAAEGAITAKIIVTGCLPARYGHDLEMEMPEVCEFIARAGKDEIVAALERAVGPSRQAAGGCADAHIVRDSTLSPYVGYVKISDGCDTRCSYCTIPAIRGRFAGYSVERIQEQIDLLRVHGVREMVLIAQDTGKWGSDRDDGRDIAWLLDTLADRYPDCLFRLLYTQPSGVSERLLEVMAQRGNVCKYLDIPVQHCNGDLLRSMNRKGSHDEYLHLVSKVRKTLGNCAVRTTLMVGYPGETEEMFDELCDFVEEAAFDYVGIFAFSAEEGTLAAELEGQIDEETKQERVAILRDIADTVSASVIRERTGCVVPVLIEGCEDDGQLFGRSFYQAPEIDGETFVDRGEVGEVVGVLLEDSLFYEMEGSVVEQF